MKKSNISQSNFGGFTLVELLIVIAIIAILAASVTLILNPLEISRQNRDHARISDLASLHAAITTVTQEATASGATVLCRQTGAYPCVGRSTSGSMASNGTGWVPVDLTQISIKFQTLPVDQSNNNQIHYTYCADNDSWELDTRLESEKLKTKMINDGGDNETLYETGSALTLIDNSAGCNY